ncbi:DUF2817 domain-containing protein [Dermatobacter hominis]|uniref:DUF2817 domain-containing protein n=1 Tax=Dermatobacter hominis TaxID=2884263 RepID=UPI001D1233CB|nr:DUF2817 domain-containing protein [Dermatobacter hominis]UDY37622.1 M14 family metallopeptidase [Dermatobacter hominis]
MRRVPLSYDECRTRFRHEVARASLEVESFPIEARGPEGQELTIDVTTFGPGDASRALLVMSGVHGVEGFIGSVLQCDLIARTGPGDLPDDVDVVVVHAVNPWGMAWWRRENESNVDLNRNWRRDDGEPRQNDAYDEIHHLACPDTPTMPDVSVLGVEAAALVERHGEAWVRDAITKGQYRHPDGMHYGGIRTEESNRILEALVEERILGREHLLVLDLHTGHGPTGEITLLSDADPSTEQHRYLTERFPGATVEATVGNPDATTGTKSGQIANGIRDLMPAGTAVSTSAEIGTAPDMEQLVATYRSRWVHRHGDRSVPEHAEAIWEYRCCFAPDDREWERRAIERGADLLSAGIEAVGGWEP